MHPKRCDRRLERARRRRSVSEQVRCQAGVVSRRQLLGAGLTRWQVRAELRAERWKAHGRQTIATHTGDLSGAARYWVAVFEAGSRAAIDGASIDGASALVLAGLRNFDAGPIRVSVPRGHHVVRRPGLNVRQTRRLRPSDIVPVGVPRVRPEIAAVRGALWARTNREAALLLTMAVQQRLVTAKAVGRALLDVRRDKRRRFIERTLLDILDGAESLGELDFSRECRLRGLPPPIRQAIRKGRGGRVYLDVFWDNYRVAVEVDGAQHLRAEASIPDALRQNAVSMQDATVLRLPLLGLRVAADDFFEQVADALVAGGWHDARATQARNVIGGERGNARSR